MNRVAKIAAAASVLLAIGLLVTWLTLGGGSTSVAFAKVADTLQDVCTATYDMTMDLEVTGKSVHTSAKCMFLAPSHDRIEQSVKIDKKNRISIWICDGQAKKSITLEPQRKLATQVDSSKIKKSANEQPDLFELVRRLVREGSAGDQKPELLGKKELDGQTVVGFRLRNQEMVDMTLWADPQTARLVQVDMELHTFGHSRGVMNNFRYDVELAPSLFSLEPPADYAVETMDAAEVPTEDDLPSTLRFLAQSNDDTFPWTIGMNEECSVILAMATSPELGAVENRYRKEQTNSPEAIEARKPIYQKQAKMYQGMRFCSTLKDENDAHYAGGGVKLGTPDRPIFWYKPAGAEKYRVLYANLSFKDVPPAELKNFPEAAMPTDHDLAKMLRFVAENNDGMFPWAIGMNVEIAQILGTSMADELMKIQEQSGRDTPEAIKAQTTLQTGAWAKVRSGMMFYAALKPENDAHYVGGSVKLGTPDRPIFWYKPTSAQQYRVLYADLTAKEADAAEVKNFPALAMPTEADRQKTMPVEETSPYAEDDLIAALRTAAEAGDGKFPEKIDMIERILQGVVGLEAKPETDRVVAKYGGWEALKKPPPAMWKEFTKAIMPFTKRHLKEMQGMQFYQMLQPENDVHYAGKDVKLGAPDRPIFWYKPIGSENYRVIYADLSVKEVIPAELKNFPAETLPTEDDLLKTLRVVAKTHHGKFPQSMEKMNDDIDIDPTEVKKADAQYGKSSPESSKAWGKAQVDQIGLQEQGMAFYKTLKPENDAHYAGKDVKLDTPDHPIFWYKPTGGDKYRVIYADLSVKELSPDEVKNLPDAKPE
jgi:outer membrane lipoprotein-sorting protein